MIFSRIHFILASLLTASLFLSGCAIQEEVHKQAAQRMAHPVLMVERVIVAPPYAITAFERMHKRGAPVHIYIGGDTAGTTGLRMFDEYDIGLHLASRDNAVNVASISLPCHYTGMLNERAPCTDFSGAHQEKFARAINHAIHDIKTTYGVTDVHLTGYGSGANLAARIAATRHDVRSLRTVSALLESAPYSLPESAYAVLQHIPQHHYVDLDENGVVTKSLARYKAKLSNDYCLQKTTILNTKDKRGWANRWNALVTQPLTCAYAATDYGAMQTDYVAPRALPPKTGWLPDSVKEKR